MKAARRPAPRTDRSGLLAMLPAVVSVWDSGIRKVRCSSIAASFWQRVSAAVKGSRGLPFSRRNYSFATLWAPTSSGGADGARSPRGLGTKESHMIAKRRVMLAACALIVLGVSTANAGPCTRVARTTGSGPTLGYTRVGGGHRFVGHKTTDTMNRVIGEKAASSQDAQKQMQDQPTAAQEAMGAKPTAQTADQGCRARYKEEDGLGSPELGHFFETKTSQQIGGPVKGDAGQFGVSGFGTFEGDRSRVCAPCVALAGDIGSTMARMSTIVRCPRCRSRPTVHSAIELRPGVEYLTLRCTSCGLVYDAQVPSKQTKSGILAKTKPPLGWDSGGASSS
jgi:hypothetical protein